MRPKLQNSPGISLKVNAYVSVWLFIMYALIFEMHI